MMTRIISNASSSSGIQMGSFLNYMIESSHLVVVLLRPTDLSERLPGKSVLYNVGSGGIVASLKMVGSDFHLLNRSAHILSSPKMWKKV